MPAPPGSLCRCLAAGALIALACVSARADTLRLPPGDDGTAFDQGSDGTFETVDATDTSGLLSRNLSNRTERAVLEFLVPPHQGQSLAAATFSAHVNLSQGPTGRPVPLSIVAYPGDGVVAVDDATAAGVVVATFDVTGPGPFEIPLDLPAPGEFFTPEDGGAIGLRVDVAGGPGGSPGVRIASTEGTASFPPPRLNLTFVPEPPGVLALAVFSATSVLRRARRGRKHAAAVAERRVG